MSSSPIGTPRSRALASLLPASSPAMTSDVFLLTEPATLAPSAREPFGRLVAGHRRRVRRSARSCGPRAASGPRPSATGSPMCSPAASSRAMSCIEAGASKKRRTEAATTGPMSGTACNWSTLAAATAVHRAERLGERLRAAFADMADAEAEDEAPQFVAAAVVDLRDRARWPTSRRTVAASACVHSPLLGLVIALPRLARLRLELQIGEALDGEVIEIGEVADQSEADQLVDERRRPARRCSSRGGQRSARDCAAAGPGNSDSGSATRPRPRAARARSRIPGTRVGISNGASPSGSTSPGSA